MISEVDLRDFEGVKIEVKEVKENEDGSADCILHFNSAGLRFLISYAFVNCLKDAIKEGRACTPDDDDIRNFGGTD
jgi:hypothetical protein